MNVICAGTTLLFKAFADKKFHLWLVLSNPDGKPGKVYAVRVVTLKHFSDTTVVLKEGDHPFIRHESSVEYGSATPMLVRDILKHIETGRCSLRQSLSEDVLRSVQTGLLASPTTPNWVKEHAPAHFGNE